LIFADSSSIRRKIKLTGKDLKCPQINDLPRPPAAQTQWPWLEQSSAVYHKKYIGKVWPKITVVTPSYNQGKFIEETIRSVLLQNYPDIEYIVLDGGSTDASVDIIKKYDKWIHHWTSQPDDGPADAIKKGWDRASGKIVAYLNSDDVYLPCTLVKAALAFEKYPEAVAINGGELRIDPDGHVLKVSQPDSATQLDLLNMRFISQPATFIKKKKLERAGGINSAIKCIYDYELWLRLTDVGKIHVIQDILAMTRWYSGTKTLSERETIADELIQVVEEKIKDIKGYSKSEINRIRHNLYYTALDIYLEKPRRFGSIIKSVHKALINRHGSKSRIYILIARKIVWHFTKIFGISKKAKIEYDWRK
jgi:glycosyltransferase involved in cell wall biosynthesis